MHPSVFEENSRRLREIYLWIGTTYSRRSQDEASHAAWNEACATLHASYDQLAFPGGLEQELELLKERDPGSIEMAVRFLEADPWFFRSGYIKADLLRWLRRAPLSDAQLGRLRGVVLERIEGPGRREFRRYARFAPRLDTPEFRAAIRARVHSADTRTSRHARWVWALLTPGEEL